MQLDHFQAEAYKNTHEGSVHLTKKDVDFILFALEETEFLAQKQFNNGKRFPKWEALADIKANVKAIREFIQTKKG